MAKEVKGKTYKATKKARTVSQSNTEWRGKVPGQKGKPGRLYGPKGQLYTGTVKLVSGDTAVYKQGKKITKKGGTLRSGSKGMTTGGGYTGKGGKNLTVTPSNLDSLPPKDEIGKGKDGNQIGLYHVGSLPGSGPDGVNSKSSSGAAWTSQQQAVIRAQKNKYLADVKTFTQGAKPKPRTLAAKKRAEKRQRTVYSAATGFVAGPVAGAATYFSPAIKKQLKGTAKSASRWWSGY